MTRGEAVNWLINIMADIGKAKHSDLWHYEQALYEIREMLEGEDTNVPSRKGVFIPDITVEMFRNASLEGVEDLMVSGEMEDISLPFAQPETEKYEYHYDHTDCIWYRPEARNRCPSTCAQYRDGWNDAMNYIFRDGKGYRPYRRGVRYEE